ncbi:hypothetical protein B0H16DRAFT_987434 [Mycena metata]|uniref:Uncharacterized protein n=1 Tax=Mycena metata TaxID=1033252 RepID=A0AAD7IL14_9AGAR|nr:hypothetical protein B0H16DRAFT_987434 [Mycena metata]
MDDFWYDISQLWVGTFFYGIYLVLFCICIYVLLHRPQNLGNTVLLATAIALFTLSTVQAVINLVLGAADIDNIDIPYDQLVNATTVIYGINNIIADGLVVYRCYSVWNKNIYVVILPILMLIPTSVFGLDYLLPTENTTFFALSLATNIIVTALTAGRIWWIHRKARAYLRRDVQQRYTSAIAILVESGVLYSATVLAYLILGAIPSVNIVQEPIYQMLTQVLGIAPTLIIVRVGLGISVQSVESTVQTAVAMSDSQGRPRHILGIRAHWSDLEKETPALPTDPDLEDGRRESIEKVPPAYGLP